MPLPFFFLRVEVGRGHVPRTTVSANSYSSAKTAHCKNAVCAGVRSGKAFEDEDGRFDKELAMEDAILLLLAEEAALGEPPVFDDEVAATRFAKTGRIPLDEIADRSEHSTAAAATASSVSSRCLALRFLLSSCSLEIAFVADAAILATEVDASATAAAAVELRPIADDWLCSSRSCVAAAHR